MEDSLRNQQHGTHVKMPLHRRENQLGQLSASSQTGAVREQI
jgi:hypothetical protein